MSDITGDRPAVPRGEAVPPSAAGRIERNVYRAAIVALLGLACYSTFEGFRAIWGAAAIAFILTGVFQLALVGSALFLGKDLAKYVAGFAPTDPTIGRRIVRYGIPSVIYIACWILCVFFAFTFYHRYLIDRGTGIDLSLPKINQLAADFVAGELTGAVQSAQRARTEEVQKKADDWVQNVRRTHKAASAETVVAGLVKSVEEARIKAKKDRDELETKIKASMAEANKDVNAQSDKVQTARDALARIERQRAEADARLKGLQTALEKEAPNPPVPGGVRSATPGAPRLPANGDAFRLTNALQCQPERDIGPGGCADKIKDAIKAAEDRLKANEKERKTQADSLDQASEALEKAKAQLATAEEQRAKLREQPSPPAEETGMTDGSAWLRATEANLDAFSHLPTAEAFKAVVKDCATSTDALIRVGQKADGAQCRPSAVEREVEDFMSQLGRYDTYMKACGGGRPVERTEAIERETRQALDGVADAVAQRQKVDDALRKALTDVVSDCVIKAREIGDRVQEKTRKVENEARDFVAGSLLNRGAQDRAYDALKSLFTGRSDLPVVGAMFLAVLQETLILCFSVLLHRSDFDSRVPASPTMPTKVGSGRRSDLDWTPNPDLDPPRVLGAKFLYASLDIDSDGSGRLVSDYAEGETDRVALNAEALVKELSALGHVVVRRNGERVIRRAGVALLESIVVAHHETTVAARPDVEARAAAAAPAAGGPAAVGTPPTPEDPPARTAGIDDPAAQTGMRGSAGAAERGDPDSQAAAAPGKPSTDTVPTPARPRRSRPRDAVYTFQRGSE